MTEKNALCFLHQNTVFKYNSKIQKGQIKKKKFLHPNNPFNGNFMWETRVKGKSFFILRDSLRVSSKTLFVTLSVFKNSVNASDPWLSKFIRSQRQFELKITFLIKKEQSVTEHQCLSRILRWKKKLRLLDMWMNTQN